MHIVRGLIQRILNTLFLASFWGGFFITQQLFLPATCSRTDNAAANNSLSRMMNDPAGRSNQWVPNGGLSCVENPITYASPARTRVYSIIPKRKQYTSGHKTDPANTAQKQASAPKTNVKQTSKHARKAPARKAAAIEHYYQPGHISAVASEARIEQHYPLDQAAPDAPVLIQNGFKTFVDERPAMAGSLQYLSPHAGRHTGASTRTCVKKRKRPRPNKELRNAPPKVNFTNRPGTRSRSA